MSRAGDKCPQCSVGLLERTKTSLKCSQCDYEQTNAELLAQHEELTRKAGEYIFKPAILKIRIEDPESAEVFLRGCILAKQNNSSPYFQQIVDGVNAILEPWREARLAEELAARGQ